MSCACVHILRGLPSGSMRYTSLPPVTASGAMPASVGGGPAAGRTCTVTPPAAAVAAGRRCGGEGRGRQCGQRGLLGAHRRGPYRAVRGRRHRGHFALRHLVQHEALARRRDAHHQTARFGAHDQVVLAHPRPSSARASRRCGRTRAPLPSGVTRWISPPSPVATNRLPLLSKAIAQMYLALGS